MIRKVINYRSCPGPITQGPTDASITLSQLGQETLVIIRKWAKPRSKMKQILNSGLVKRDIEVDEPLFSQDEFLNHLKNGRPESHIGAAIFLYGIIAEQPCTECAPGGQIFASCVISDIPNLRIGCAG
jgi:hypothetical protein